MTRERLAEWLITWLEQQLAAIPPGGTLTVTWRRDGAGRLSREVIVRREGRETVPERGANSDL